MTVKKNTLEQSSGTVNEKMKCIRLLLANEIECRVGMQRADGCSLLLYKDARVDMRLLDEHFGAMNWKRDHVVVNGNLFCTISIWDDKKNEWVSKQDVGTESKTEAEKGQASDSFKRAGFNWGIGRELYTAPFIWVTLTQSDLGANGKLKTRFVVMDIGYNENREIDRLVITDGKNVRYTYGNVTEQVNHPQSKNSQTKQQTTDNTNPVFTGAQLKQAIEEMNACMNRKQVNETWSKYPQIQNDKEFRDTCMVKCQQFPK